MSKNEVSNVYFLERMLILASDSNGQAITTKCKFHYQPQTQTINFTNTLHHLCLSNNKLKNLLQNTQLFYMDEQHRTKHFLGQFPLQDCRLFFEDWTTSSIVISYRKHDPPPIMQRSTMNVCKKSRERTIKEVKGQIERWRQVTEENAASGITLRKAAKSIGMSKKSIDDYLRFLRVAQRLNFDFKTFEGEKMGFLRAFVRQKLRQPIGINIQQEIDSYWDSTYISKEES